jgi:hypothetical protein
MTAPEPSTAIGYANVKGLLTVLKSRPSRCWWLSAQAENQSPWASWGYAGRCNERAKLSLIVPVRWCRRSTSADFPCWARRVLQIEVWNLNL